MIISDFAIKRPLITVVTMVAIAVFGLFALFSLKTDEFPDVAPPFVSVGIPYPGASPDVVEKEVLKPVEDQISAINGVKQVQGYAYDGFAQVVIEFYFGKELNVATQEVRDAISGIRSDLPDEMKEPVIKKLNDTDRPIVSLALSSSVLSPAELTRLADPDITRQLRSIPGVAEVDVFGNVDRQLTVEVRPRDLQAMGVSVAQVVQALQAQSLAAPVGRVIGSLTERSIRLKGRMESPAEFEQLVVAERNGRVIRLGDVANVRDGSAEPRTLALYDGAEAVGLDIKKAKGYSTTAVSDQVRARVAEIQKTLPEGTHMDLVKDSGVRVTAAVSNVEEALVLGALLTVLVVFLFLNSWRSTVITGLALPVSVLAAFIAVLVMGFKLETMSLLGLSLAIGILIDDAIVVRENIVRHVEMGKDHYTAAHDGTDEIGLAVAATTFSILAVFVPIGFMPGIGGQWFKPFALTIACAVAVSLFVSFSLDPMLSAYWPDPHKPDHERAWISRKLTRFNHWFNHQAENYKLVVAWALDHRWAMVTIAAGTFFAAFLLPGRGLSGLAAAMLGLGVVVFALVSRRLPVAARVIVGLAGVAGFVVLPHLVPPVASVGVGFFPEDDRGELTVHIETPPGSNLQYTRLKSEETARFIRAHKDLVLHTYATLGAQATGEVDEGDIYVKMVPREDRPVSVEQFAAMLRDETKHVAGVTLSVFTSDFGGGRKQLALQVRGDNLAAINVAADTIAKIVRQVPGAVDVDLSTKGLKPELNIELNRGIAGALGITVGQVAQSLRPAFAGLKAGTWIDPSGEPRDVEVRLTPEARRRAADLQQLPLVVPGPNGLPMTLPLGQVATITDSVGPAIIDHLDREQVVNVELNTSGRASGDVTADIQSRLAHLRLPPGVRLSYGGDAQNQNEVFGQIFTALGIAVGLMYLILVVQFGSFLDPLAIMVSLPLSLIGVMLALAITHNTVNIMSLIGIMLLMGIVAKNAILLIDFAKWSREEQGTPLRQALIEAGAIRLRPILMTTFALIAGMIPVALGRGEGAQFRAPLGVAVIGGVITSTLLTLLVIPTFYEILDGLRGGVARKFGFHPPHTAEHAVPAVAAGQAAMGDD
ncbi:MAG TPA: efflux RND transporter permease subunit [Gemmatimonadaceae bacterium]|jgi:HAE1 family hydrophobic/amphiphilic exporter-1|nr:efflux RND transporter permease subunit [Gemmatimonadaceae bacterium]